MVNRRDEKYEIKISLFKNETSLPGNEDRTNEPEIGGCSRGAAVRVVAIFQILGAPHAQWRIVKYSRRFSRPEYASYGLKFKHCCFDAFFGLGFF